MLFLMFGHFSTRHSLNLSSFFSPFMRRSCTIWSPSIPAELNRQDSAQIQNLLRKYKMWLIPAHFIGGMIARSIDLLPHPMHPWAPRLIRCYRLRPSRLLRIRLRWLTLQRSDRMTGSRQWRVVYSGRMVSHYGLVATEWILHHLDSNSTIALSSFLLRYHGIQLAK